MIKNDMAISKIERPMNVPLLSFILSIRCFSAKYVLGGGVGDVGDLVAWKMRRFETLCGRRNAHLNLEQARLHFKVCCIIQLFPAQTPEPLSQDPRSKKDEVSAQQDTCTSSSSLQALSSASQSFPPGKMPVKPGHFPSLDRRTVKRCTRRFQA